MTLAIRKKTEMLLENNTDKYVTISKKQKSKFSPKGIEVKNPNEIKPEMLEIKEQLERDSIMTDEDILDNESIERSFVKYKELIQK